MFAFPLWSVSPVCFLCCRAVAVQERRQLSALQNRHRLGASLGWWEMRFAAFQDNNEEMESGSPTTGKSFLISRLLFKYPYQRKNTHLGKKPLATLCYSGHRMSWMHPENKPHSNLDFKCAQSGEIGAMHREALSIQGALRAKVKCLGSRGSSLVGRQLCIYW